MKEKSKPRKADAYSRRSLEKAAKAAMEARKQKDEKNAQTTEQDRAEQSHARQFPKA
jgi:hypothetical protein